MKFCLFLGLCFLPFFSSSQGISENLISWVDSNSISIRSNDDYLSVLQEEMSTRSVLGLGEASHGTKEFFTEKNRIIEYFIQHANYKQIGFEFTDGLIQLVNQYINTGEGDLKILMKDFRLYNTQAFFDLFTSLKRFNQGKPENEKVQIFGFDDNYHYPDRDSLMARNVLDKLSETGQKVIIWGHDVHLAKDKTAGFEAMGGLLHRKIGDHYYSIAFDTFQGTVTNVQYENEQWKIYTNTLRKPEKSFTAFFAQSKYPDFFVQFKSDNPFFGTVNNKTHIFADWREPFEIPTALGKDFNAFIFFRETSASQIYN